MSINLESQTIKNNYYRKVIKTEKNMQLVLMSLNYKEVIDLEMHPDTDQFIRVEKGSGLVLFTDKKGYIKYKIKLKDGHSIIIPKGTYHMILNTGKDKLKLYTIYSPPNHPKKLIQKIKPATH